VSHRHHWVKALIGWKCTLGWCGARSLTKPKELNR
jgi:hypothetical protein